MRASFLFFFLPVIGLIATSAKAQNRAEPQFPPTCTVLAAGAPDQPSLQSALDGCKPGQAVELVPGSGPDDYSFTIDPITIPARVSLIVDGGVTVYGTTEARVYQTRPPPGVSPANWICGRVDYYAKSDIIPCKPLITMSSNSGIYGYGIIDGQGGSQIQEENGEVGPSWWDLIDLKTDDECAKEHPSPGSNGESCLEGSPHMITMGTDIRPAANVVLYKITLRNPPMEAVTLKGRSDVWSAILWGVKIQAPWNRGNTGALNLAGSNMLVKDNILSVGDQDIALEGSVGTNSAVTSNIDIDGLRVYSRAGIALLDAGKGFSHITVNDFAMTGDVPSYIPGPDPASDGSVNGVSASQIKKKYGISVYNALPGSLGDSAALQLFTGSLNKDPHTAENVTFKDACIIDVATPINVEVQQPGPGLTGTNGGANTGQIGPIYFDNIHVLPSSSQFVTSGSSGGTPQLYQFEMVGNTDNPSHITFDNFVYGNGETAAGLIGTMDVENNIFFTRANVFPDVFNSMVPPSGNAAWTFNNNSYNATTGTTSPERAYRCPVNLFPFITGELFADLQGESSGNNANRQIATVNQSDMVTLNAIVQPTMSQAELFNKDYKHGDKSTLAVPSPPLNGLVSFYDNGSFIGTAPLAGNGTIAALRINTVGRGVHFFTAEYVDPPGAIFYEPFRFGHVIIIAHR